MLALGLNEGAYMAEIVRAGINSVDKGQTEAAHALGMTRLLTMRRIVLPQAMRVIIPPTGNEINNMLKTTSLVSAIAVTELLTRREIVYTNVSSPAVEYPHRREHLVPRHHDDVTFRQTASSATTGAASRAASPAAASQVVEQRNRRRLLPPMTAMVSAGGVHKHFGRLEVLKGVSLDVAPGEVICILGPSGSGKTTFIRCINHLEKIDGGRITGSTGARRLSPVRRQAP